MRQANIFYKDLLAGILTENDAGYEFRYLPEYLSLETAKTISLTLPLRKEAYTSPVLFPFFDGMTFTPEHISLRTLISRYATLLSCTLAMVTMTAIRKPFLSTMT